jgi:large subunit ribosomal protein L14
MIQTKTKLKVADNTGVKVLQCIRILKGSQPRTATVGDLIVGVIKEAEPKRELKKKQKVWAVVIRTKKEIKRKDGTYVRFDDNACVIVDKNTLEPKGSRIVGPVALEVKEKGFEKVAALVEELV